jgi:N4-gp56 family major capsid protein
MAQTYNNPIGGTDSTIGTQFRTDYYIRKALKEARKESYFSQLADVTSMPKHMGKKIRRYHYVPLLDDANVNDQGIDAAGVSTTVEVTIVIARPEEGKNIYTNHYAVGEGATTAAALTAAKAKAVDIFKALKVFTTSYAATKTALTGATPAWTIDDSNAGVPVSGNLYGSSKDVGTISAKLPALTENGGFVNRVGFTRVDLEGTFEKFGMYYDYTKESLDFDTDAELQMHLNRELMSGAIELTEDALQVDLLNAAGVIRYAGSALTTSELSGETGNVSQVTYNDLMRLAIDLSNNRTPKNTKVITGTRMIDTKTVNSAYIMYIGSELIPMVKAMVDGFGNQAFIDARHYAAGTTLLRGEIGAIDQFRLVVVPEMAHWDGAGKTVTNNAGYYETGGKYNVYPMLVVGSESFTTIGFETNGKSFKFKTKHVKPESPESYARDPYGETGFSSLKYYYGFMALRPERIALVKTVAAW